MIQGVLVFCRSRDSGAAVSGFVCSSLLFLLLLPPFFLGAGLGHSSRTLEGNSRIRSESVSGVLPVFLGSCSGMSQPYWGCGPFTVRYEWATYGKCTRGGSDKQ